MKVAKEVRGKKSLGLIKLVENLLDRVKSVNVPLPGDHEWIRPLGSGALSSDERMNCF